MFGGVNLNNPLEMGVGKEGGGAMWAVTELEMRLGDWIWRRGEEGENLLLDHLLLWLEWSPGSQSFFF